jgi:hypothetical protein
VRLNSLLGSTHGLSMNYVGNFLWRSYATTGWALAASATAPAGAFNVAQID